MVQYTHAPVDGPHHRLIEASVVALLPLLFQVNEAKALDHMLQLFVTQLPHKKIHIHQTKMKTNSKAEADAEAEGEVTSIDWS